MHTTLRRRLLLVIAPAFLLLALTGGVGAWLLILLGQRSSAILRENYNSVRAMDQLLFALHQIDESYRLALAGREEQARTIMLSASGEFQKQIIIEENNITIVPQEQQLVDLLTQTAAEYRKLGDQFFGLPPSSTDRPVIYSKLALLQQKLTSIAQQIHDLNETHMQHASRDAQQTAQQSIIGFSIGLLIALAALLAALWWLDRTVVVPIRSVRDAAQSIGSGQLHLMVPVHSHDEIGELAQEFNAMTSKLRVYKQSDMEALRRAQQTRQATIDSFPDPIIVLDPSGYVESANPAAQQLFGIVTPRVGQQGEKWNAPEPLQAFLDQFLLQKQNLESNSFEQVITFRFQNEERAYLPQARLISSPDGEYLGAAIVLSDVTRFRLLDKFKTDWVATVSHELKTPLTSVRLAVHVLLEEAVGPLEPKQIELLLEARENTERLFKLIEQLLALARLEDGRELLEIESIDPRQLLQRAIDDAYTRAEDKRIELKLEIADSVRSIKVDTVRLGRALANLVDNAITYTLSGGSITLGAKQRNDHTITLFVRDTGIGIPAEYLPHIFDRFFRIPGRDQSPGTGLGLAIVKEIIEAHEGTIRCISKEQQGTTFEIDLPVAGDLT